MASRGGNVLFDDAGAVPLPEISTPTAEDGIEKIYTKSNNRTFFQDGTNITFKHFNLSINRI